MKTSLASISLLLAASIPGTIIADFVGVRLPASLDTETVLSAFVIVVTLLTAFADYSQRVRPFPIRARVAQPVAPVATLSNTRTLVKLAA